MTFLSGHFAAKLQQPSPEKQAKAQEQKVLLQMEQEAKITLGRSLNGQSVTYDELVKLNTGVVLQRLSAVVITDGTKGFDAGKIYLHEVEDTIQSYQQSGQKLVMTETEVQLLVLLQHLYEDNATQYQERIKRLNTEQRQLLKRLGFIGELIEYNCMNSTQEDHLINVRAQNAHLAHRIYRIGLFLLILLICLYVVHTALNSYTAHAVELINVEVIKPQHTAPKLLGIFCYGMIVLFWCKALIPDFITARLCFVGILLVSLSGYKWFGGDLKWLWHDLGFRKTQAVIDLPPLYCWFVVLSLLIGYGSFLLYPELVDMLRGGRMDFAPVMTEHHPLDNLVAKGNWLLITGVTLLAVIYAPLVEETLDRGLLLIGLIKISSSRYLVTMSLIIGTLITGVLFSIVHPQDWIFWGVIYGASTVMCFLRLRFNSIWPAIIYHAVVNAASIAYVGVLYQ